MSQNLRQLRQARFQFFFHLNFPISDELRKEPSAEVISQEFALFLAGEDYDLNSKEKDQIIQFVLGNLENYDEVYDLIAKYSKKWKPERLAKIDLTLISMAFYELKYKKTPYKVVINESVELAKKFGTKESPTFINGILDKFYQEEIKND